MYCHLSPSLFNVSLNPEILKLRNWIHPKHLQEFKGTGLNRIIYLPTNKKKTLNKNCAIWLKFHPSRFFSFHLKPLKSQQKNLYESTYVLKTNQTFLYISRVEIKKPYSTQINFPSPTLKNLPLLWPTFANAAYLMRCHIPACREFQLWLALVTSMIIVPIVQIFLIIFWIFFW